MLAGRNLARDQIGANRMSELFLWLHFSVCSP